MPKTGCPAQSTTLAHPRRSGIPTADARRWCTIRSSGPRPGSLSRLGLRHPGPGASQGWRAHEDGFSGTDDSRRRPGLALAFRVQMAGLLGVGSELGTSKRYADHFDHLTERRVKMRGERSRSVTSSWSATQSPSRELRSRCRYGRGFATPKARSGSRLRPSHGLRTRSPFDGKRRTGRRIAPGCGRRRSGDAPASSRSPGSSRSNRET